VIDRMVAIVQRDSPWSFGIFPGSTGVYQQWAHNAKPSGIINDRIRYLRIDGALRAQKIAEWNRPRAWPLGVIALILAFLAWPAWAIWRRREAATARASKIAIATGRAD